MTTQCQGLHACTGLYASCCFAGGHGGAQAMTTQPLQCQGLNADLQGLPVQCKACATVELVQAKQLLCQTHFHQLLLAITMPRPALDFDGPVWRRLASVQAQPSPDAIDVPYEEFLPRD